MKNNNQKNNIQEAAITKAIDVLIDSGADITTLFQQDGIMTHFKRNLVERVLQGELTHHLGYGRYEHAAKENNSRNGSSRKRLLTEDGVLDIEVPRDRQGSFEPKLIEKRQTRLDGFNDKIISLYAKGMSVNDIKIQLQELYGGIEISNALISEITDEVIDEVTAWQNRPLESIYAVVYFDCIVIKVRQDKRIINKSVYVALGITLSGLKEVLGLWMSENEGAKFWLGNLTELKNRGLQDILIACTDNLTGMNAAITSVFPKTEHQLCVVHQIRNSFKFASYKDRKEIATDLKPIYTAPTEESALAALECFAEKWDKKYPYIAKSWYANWDNLAIFLQYPSEIRRVIYTTNAIESLNSQLRKVTKNKRVFPNDDAVFKTLYLAIEYISKKWTMPIRNWSEAMAHFMVKFEGRF